MKPTLFRAGHDFHGPDGQGYTLTRDVHPYDLVSVGLFKPYGGAPKPKVMEKMPDWLIMSIWPNGLRGAE